jgi:hypothetical protein
MILHHLLRSLQDKRKMREGPLLREEIIKGQRFFVAMGTLKRLLDVNEIRDATKVQLPMNIPFSSVYLEVSDLNPKTKAYAAVSFHRVGKEGPDIPLPPSLDTENTDWLVTIYLQRNENPKSIAAVSDFCFFLDNEGYLSHGVTDTATREWHRNQGTLDFCGELIAYATCFFQIIACSNVEVSEVPLSRLNQKRMTKKGIPCNSYHVVHLLQGRGKYKRAESLGGSHASPRQHWRRGHVRRLPSGNTTWVSSCVVGDPTNGVIVKDYLAV